MSDVDMSGAIEALQSELPDSADAPTNLDEGFVEDQPAVDVESFTGFNPSDLPEDLQSVYRSMQGDYTRKTQEIAELRRTYEGYDAFSEAGVDPNYALQAADFYRKLDTDPQFAQQVVDNIQRNLGTVGVEQQSIGDAPYNDSVNSEGYDSLPPVLQQELAEMREFRSDMMFQQEQAETIAGLEYVEQEIRLSNPHYTDDDLSSIYDLAYSTDGDLSAAADAYHSIQQRVMSGYLQSKQAPMGVQPIPTGPSSIPPRQFSSLDEAHRAAMEAVRNSL
jgi:hypothetical protein